MTQREALDILKTGANVFLTGAAGSGKTHVLREYLAILDERGIAVGVTASTGIAATHMGGMTIHAWSGIGVKDHLSAEEIDEISQKEYVRKKVEAAKVLIIDEISMLHHFRLDLVDSVLKEIRHSEEPFGGIQIVVCGDFFQLPPVARFGEMEAQFAYHSLAWRDAGFVICYLEEQHRQNDPHYTNILNAVRAGMMGEDSDLVEALQGRFNADMVSFVQPTRLYARNVDVDAENERELAKIAGTPFQYEMHAEGNKKLVETLKKGCLAHETLRLKKGAQVMFVKNNYELGYANGTRGVVDECSPERVIVRVTDGRLIEVERESWHIEDRGRVLAEIDQYPLRLAWAITIHKSQGMSLDAAHIDLSNSFEKGMGYVALSRVRSLSGLSLSGFNERALHIHEEALLYDKFFREQSMKQGAAYAVMAADELRQLQHAFIGPDPAEGGAGRKGKVMRGVRGMRAPKGPKEPKIPSTEKTKKLIDAGMTVLEAAKERGMTFGTVLGHIEELRAEDPRWNISHLRETIPVTRFQKIASAFNKIGMQEGGRRSLTPVKKILGGAFTFEELRMVRLFL